MPKPMPARHAACDTLVRQVIPVCTTSMRNQAAMPMQAGVHHPATGGDRHCHGHPGTMDRAVMRHRGHHQQHRRGRHHLPGVGATSSSTPPRGGEPAQGEKQHGLPAHRGNRTADRRDHSHHRDGEQQFRRVVDARRPPLAKFAQPPQRWHGHRRKRRGEQPGHGNRDGAEHQPTPSEREEQVMEVSFLRGSLLETVA